MRSFVIWLAVVGYMMAAQWAIHNFWRHDMVMKVVLLAPVGIFALGLLVTSLFEDQIWKIRHAIARRRALRQGPIPLKDMVTLHLRYDSRPSEEVGLSDIFALQEELSLVIEKKKLGSFDGNEIDPEEAVLFMSGPDADAMFLGIEPILRACPLCKGAIVRMTRYVPKESEREVRL